MSPEIKLKQNCITISVLLRAAWNAEAV